MHVLTKHNINLQNARYTLYQHKCQAVFFRFCPVTDCQWFWMVRFSKRSINSHIHRTWTASCEFKLCSEIVRVSIGSRTIICQPLDPPSLHETRWVSYCKWPNDRQESRKRLYAMNACVCSSCLYCKKKLCSCFRSVDPRLEPRAWMYVVYELYNWSFLSTLKFWTY